MSHPFSTRVGVDYAEQQNWGRSMADHFQELLNRFDILANRFDGFEALIQRLNPVEDRKSYSTKEFAEIVERQEFTVREWCRQGRIYASKRDSGRGKHGEWLITHDELIRYRNEGLLPR